MKICIMPLVNTKQQMPIEFQIPKNSMYMSCVHSIMSANVDMFDKIIFGVFCDHESKWNISSRVKNDLECMARLWDVILPKIEFIYIDKATKSMAETVMVVINQAMSSDIGVSEDDEIFIKDGDNSWKGIGLYDTSGNFVTVTSLEDLTVADPSHKSYIKIDEHGFITNCIEKKVISDKFIAGGYSFANIKLFIEAYNSLKDLSGIDDIYDNIANTTNNINNVFYISDMIYWLILYKNVRFRPVFVKDFKDFNV